MNALFNNNENLKGRLMCLVLLFLLFTSATIFGMDQNNTPEYYQRIAHQLLDNPHDQNLLDTITSEEEQHVAEYILHDLINRQPNNTLNTVILIQAGDELDEANNEFIRRSQALAAELEAQPSAQILYGPSSSSSQPMGAPSSNTLHRLESDGFYTPIDFYTPRTASEFFMEPKQKKNTFSLTNFVSMFTNIGKSWYHFIFPLPIGPCVYQTDPSIKKQLNAAREKFELASQNISVLSPRITVLSHAWLDEIGHIALTAGNLMSEQDKLENLVGDARWKDRKEIIKKMVAVGHTNPNTITYQHDTSPLYESFIHKDIAFAQYLLNHGARADADWKGYYLISKSDFVAWFAQHTRTPLTVSSKNTSKSWYNSLAACCFYYCTYAKKGIFSFIPYNRQPLLTQTPNSPYQPAIALVDTCYTAAVDNLRLTTDATKRCAVIKQFEGARKDLIVQIKAVAPEKLKQFDQEYITSQLQKASECPVCLDHFSDHFGNGKAGAECTLSCDHSLCTTCFSKCQTACPICRKAIS